MRRPLLPRAAFSGPSLLYLAVVLAAAGWMGSHLFPPINLDVGALLYVARQWLAGDKLYVDIIDVNTPWAIAIHVPPEWLAAHTGIASTTWFSLLVILAIVISLLLSLRLLEKHAAVFGPLTATALPLFILFVLGVSPSHNFGQREHLMTVAATPWLLLAALRAGEVPVSRALMATVVVFAGLGFAIKPHFLACVLLVEVALLIRRGWRRTLLDPAPWLLLAVFVAHVIFAVLVTPEYFTVLLPMASQTYAKPAATIGHGLDILLGPNLAPVAMVLVPLAVATFAWSRSPLTRFVVLFAIGGGISAIIQGKGFDYHTVPAAAGTLLLGLLLIVELVERSGTVLLGRVDVMRLLTALIVLPIFMQQGLRERPLYDQLDFRTSQAGRWLDMIARIGGNGRTLVLSGGMYPQFPAINYAGLQMTMPFLTMWPLTDFYDSCEPGQPRYRPLPEQSFAEHFFFQTVVDGFVEDQPTLLVIDSTTGIPDCDGEPFRYLDYFLRDGRFAAAFKAYRPVATLGQYAFYKRQTLRLGRR